MKKGKIKIFVVVIIFGICVCSFLNFIQTRKISEYITDKKIVYTPGTIAKKYYSELSIDIFEYWIFVLNDEQKQELEKELSNNRWSEINELHLGELSHFLMYEEELGKILKSKSCYVCVYDRYNDKIITDADKFVYDSLTQKIMFVYEAETGTYICLHETM